MKTCNSFRKRFARSRRKNPSPFPDAVWAVIRSLVPRDRDASSPVAAVFNSATRRWDPTGRYSYPGIELRGRCPGCGSPVRVTFRACYNGTLDRGPCSECAPVFGTRRWMREMYDENDELILSNPRVLAELDRRMWNQLSLRTSCVVVNGAR